jgi:hypothetical protein
MRSRNARVTRRDLLREAGAASLVLGFPLLGRGTAARSDGAEVLRAALDRMRRNRQEGVALVVPSGKAEREALGKALEKLVASGDPETAELLAEAVYLCVPRTLVDAREGENAVLLDPERKGLAGSSLDIETLETKAWKVPAFAYASGGAEPSGCREIPGGTAVGFPVKFEEGLRALLRGEGRLDVRAKKVSTPQLEAAVRDLESASPGDPVALNRAYTFLAENFERHAAAIVAARIEREKSGCPSALRDIVHQAFVRALYEKEADSLLLGVEWETVHHADPCPTCGMGFAPLVSRRFLRFLAQ